MKFKTWQLWGLMPVMLGGMALYSNISQPKQADAVPTITLPREPLTPQDLIKQRLKQSPTPRAGAPKAAPGVTLTTLYRFKGSDGERPFAGLNYIDNTFYGTTAYGGANGDGTIFKLTPAGHKLTTLHSFNRTDSFRPFARLISDKDKNFYGTTVGGGAYDSGTIFKLSPSGTLTTLHSFNGKEQGHAPFAKLLRNGSGYLFGTTIAGGRYNRGTIFRLSPGGAFKVLHQFKGIDGSGSAAGLIQDSVGNFYGTTVGGGANGDGTVFQIKPDGTLTTLHSFNGRDGSRPYTELIQDSDGNLFGTTFDGGASGSGTVFKLPPDGTLTTLHSFSYIDGTGINSDGGYPSARLIQDSVGNLFSTTSNGGANGDGTVFQIKPDGTFTSLYSFGGGRDGNSPNDVRIFKGALYGTTISGGALTVTPCKRYGCGTIFKLSISPSAPVRKHSRQPMLQSLPEDPNS